MHKVTHSLTKLVLESHPESKTSLSKSISKIKMETIPYISWTDKSKDIQFKSSKTGIGDGEEKVAAELDTTVLGQNSSYDMMIIVDSIERKADVKKLDKKTFNTGVEGRNLLRPIKNNITSLLELLSKLVGKINLTDKENKEIESLKDVSPDEICVGTLKLLKSVCTNLHNKQKEIRASFPEVKGLINPYTGLLVEMTAEKYYKLAIEFNFPYPDELLSYRSNLELINLLNHVYVLDPSRIDTDLNSLTIIFDDIILIFVDNEKGYYILKDHKDIIKFERITRGNPRFRVCI